MIYTQDDALEVLSIELFKWKRVGVCIPLNFHGETFISQSVPGVILNLSREKTTMYLNDIDILISDSYGDLEDFMEFVYSKQDELQDNIYFHLSAIRKYAKIIYSTVPELDF